ncbi:MAG: DUF4982 domain-containing protein [Chitinophagaceae bacterium]|nr:DUF4982 domain-containing protein [Chitinophagaceae bacterium]
MQMRYLYCVLVFCLLQLVVIGQPRPTIDFNEGWKFYLGDDSLARDAEYDDSKWRKLSLPHDWSIESDFKKEFPATNQGGALPGGVGWYRKQFILPATAKDKTVRIHFGGVYQNSEVWINDHYLGKRPNGYISFSYDLTPYLIPSGNKNIIAVKVDNSQQPNSRWYTGSGIYRKVSLIVENKIAFDRQGTFIKSFVYSSKGGSPVSFDKTSPGPSYGLVNIEVHLRSKIPRPGKITLAHRIYDAGGKKVASSSSPHRFELDTMYGTTVRMDGGFTIKNPVLWSIKNPYLYKVVSSVLQDNILMDEVVTNIGIRSCSFDSEKGFFLNDESLKIQGVCLHHDFGALGSAFNIAAAKRQLRILKEMGCNAIRFSHNPPAEEMLDLCDQMGFLVVDESFDMWQKRKNKFDYHLEFKEWHKRDLEDMVRRDRNHPSIFMWSIGNEIREQFDSTGINLTRELADIVRNLDNTRPVTSALTEMDTTKNFIWLSNALDIPGWNYRHQIYADYRKNYPGKKFIALETASAFQTRGAYSRYSDSIFIMPEKGKIASDYPDNDYTTSAYDNTYAYWGSTHEAPWKLVKANPHLSGLFVWSGFDYLGEPTPYNFPARSSYFGIVDLAGFPKDIYYMYQSEWTSKPVLHIFPAWNAEVFGKGVQRGDSVDVWAYFNNADEVELFLNSKSVGVRRKGIDDVHIMWRLPFQPGTLKAVSRKSGKIVLTKELKTAGKPFRLELIADRKMLKTGGRDLSFITARVLDRNGIPVPFANNLLKFTISGEGIIAGTDNGFQADLVSLKSKERKAWKGLALAIVQATGKKGNITLRADSAGLLPAILTLTTSD